MEQIKTQHLKNGVKRLLPPNGYEMHEVEREYVSNEILKLFIKFLNEEVLMKQLYKEERIK